MATNTKINGKDYYKITRTVGYKIVDGVRKPVKKQFYGSSKRNAEQKYEVWKASQNTNYNDPLRLTEDVAAEFNARLEVDSGYASSTRELYIRSYMRNFKTTGIGKIPIGQLHHTHIQNAYNSFTGSHDSLLTFHKWMRLFIGYCEMSGYCSDVMRLVVIPQKEKVTVSDDIEIWEDDEIALIEEKLKEHTYYPCIMLSLYAGLRIGEVLGLKWTDIKPDGIHIERQYNRKEICSPKNNSYRIIPIHRKIKEALEDYPHTSEYIFVTASGEHINYRNFTRSLERAYKRYDIPHKSYHAYRRTFTTKLCRADVPIQTASKLLGHKSIQITAKHYAKVKHDELTTAIDRI